MSALRKKNCELKKIKHLKVKNLCVENSKEKNVEITNLKATNTNVTNFSIGGINLNCFLQQPTTENIVYGIETTFGPTGPVKPKNVDQRVWDCLISNSLFELNDPSNGLQARVNKGRLDIANYTYLPAIFTGMIEGNLLTVEIQSGELSKGRVIQGNGVIPGTKIISQEDINVFVVNFTQNVAEEEMSSPPRCPQPCPFEIDAPKEIEIYGYQTLPIFTQSTCGGTGVTGTTGTTGGTVFNSFVKNMDFNLDVYYQLAVAESTEARLVSVLCQVGYIDPLGPTGCGFVCDSDENVVLHTVYIGNKQFYPTLDVEYGENYAVSIPVPSVVIDAAVKAMPDPNNTGAVQLVFYKEPGICIWSPIGDCNFECREGGEGKDSKPNPPVIVETQSIPVGACDGVINPPGCTTGFI
jgi:hypothetical protein